MNKIVSILWELRFVIIVAAAIVLFFIILGWQKTREILYVLMLQAKSKAKDMVLASGQEQEDWTVKAAMKYSPLPVKVFLNILGEALVRKIIHWLYHTAKDKLDDGKINNSL